MFLRSPSRNNTTGSSGSSRAFTLLEILITFSILAILAVLSMSVVNRMKTTSLNIACINNLRLIGNGFSLFLSENNNIYPGTGPGAKSGSTTGGSLRWHYRVGLYMDLSERLRTFDAGNGELITVRDFSANINVFHCPTTPPWFYEKVPGRNWSLGIYGVNNRIVTGNDEGFNLRGISATAISKPSRTVLLADRYSGGGSRAGTDEAGLGGANINTAGPYPIKLTGPSANHRGDRNAAAVSTGAGNANFLFCDGHVETIRLETLNPWPGSGGTEAIFDL